MVRKVAVERNLRNVKEYFENQGYKVDIFEDTELEDIKTRDNYEAIIISGGNKDLCGMQDTLTSIPVIDATGMTPEELLNRLDNKG
jgi:phosphoribosylcarboxyaminoimidazole (NCAIR) mutase